MGLGMSVSGGLGVLVGVGARGVAVGIGAGTLDDLNKRLDQGLRFMMYGTDSSLLAGAARADT